MFYVGIGMYERIMFVMRSNVCSLSNRLEVGIAGAFVPESGYGNVPGDDCVNDRKCSQRTRAKW